MRLPMPASCSAVVPLLGLLGILAVPVPSDAQGFGIGGRMSMVRADVDSDDDSVRFTGGQIRLGMSSRTSLEVSLDRHTETFDLLNARVKETPLQASLLLYLARGSFAPYLLGGPGWYWRTVEAIDNQESIEDQSTRTFGWHAGFGAEIRMGRHFGLHGDYRYTQLNFDDDEEEENGAGGGGNKAFINGLLPSHDGSMWTVGLTVYF
jgi:opacity protein-like surface antigen